jgi:hypothetical protein
VVTLDTTSARFLAAVDVMPHVVAMTGVVLIAGVPTTILDDFPVLKDYRNNIAKLDFVAKYYADVTEGPRATYKADA